MRLLTLALAGSLAAVCHAQEPRSFEWKVNEKSAPADSGQASRDGFGVMMVVTDDYAGFLKAWEGPSPPQVSTTSSVRRGQPVHAMLLFSGCRAGPNGNCDVVGQLSVEGPSGSPYGETLQADVWKGRPAPGYNLQLSEAGLGFVLEPNDKLGTYRIRATVTDRIAGVSLLVEQKLTAGDSK